MASLTYGQRKKLPKSSFAVPGNRGYPIPDLSHARNALARASEYGSPSVKAEVRGAVDKRYPQLKKKKARRRS